MHLSRVVPHTSWDTASIHNLLKEDALNLESIERACRRGHFNATAFYRMTKIPFFRYLDNEEVILNEIERTGERSRTFRVVVRMIARDTDILKAILIDHLNQTDSTPEFIR